MNSLDSRWLRYGDTFIQKFSRSGAYTYDFGLPGVASDARSRRFPIRVEQPKEKRDPKQHFVSVRPDRDGRLVAVPRELVIEAGDVVLWSAANSAVRGFSVAGASEAGDVFASAAMTNEAVYTHAFGNAGVFAWTDAHNPRIRGTITVRAVETRSREDTERHRARLGEATVVTIRGNEVQPPNVEIVVGQTIFFAIDKADRVSITDTRLMNGDHPVMD